MAEIDMDAVEAANLRSFMVYLLSACAHYQEFVDTGHPVDLMSAKDALLVSADLRQYCDDNPVLMPRRRDGKSFFEALE